MTIALTLLAATAVASARPACTQPPPGAASSPVPLSVMRSVPPPAIAARLLAEHNRARAAVGVPPLIWDQRLAISAAAWAPELSRLGRLVHSPRGARVCQRENLLQALPGRSPEQMVQVWVAERRNFVPGIFPNVSRTGNWADIAHYSQIVWRQTTSVGCAIFSDRRFDWLVCRYSPPGNIDGRRVP
jgi:hypothetical protein